MEILRGEGGGKKAGGGRTYGNALEGSNNIKVAYALSEGEVKGLVDTNGNDIDAAAVDSEEWGAGILINGVPIRRANDNANNITVENLGFTKGDVAVGDDDELFAFGGNTTTLNAPLTYNNPYTAVVSATEVSTATITLSTNGLISFDDSGNIHPRSFTVILELYYVKSDGTRHILARHNAVISGRTTSEYREDYTFYGLGALTADKYPLYIQATRITGDDTNNTKVSSSSFLQAITTRAAQKFTYPNTSFIVIEANSSQFSQTPQIAARMRGKLVRVPVNYWTDDDIKEVLSDFDTAIEAATTEDEKESKRSEKAARELEMRLNRYGRKVEGIDTTIFDGTFRKNLMTGAIELKYTDNPVWCLLDLLTNERYGLGDRIKDENIDMASFYAVAKLCDELTPDGKGELQPRFRLSLYIQQQLNAIEWLQAITQSFRGFMRWENGKVSLECDVASLTAGLTHIQQVKSSTGTVAVGGSSPIGDWSVSTQATGHTSAAQATWNDTNLFLNNAALGATNTEGSALVSGDGALAVGDFLIVSVLSGTNYETVDGTYVLEVSSAVVNGTTHAQIPYKGDTLPAESANTRITVSKYTPAESSTLFNQLLLLKHTPFNNTPLHNFGGTGNVSNINTRQNWYLTNYTANDYGADLAVNTIKYRRGLGAYPFDHYWTAYRRTIFGRDVGAFTKHIVYHRRGFAQQDLRVGRHYTITELLQGVYFTYPGSRNINISIHRSNQLFMKITSTDTIARREKIRLEIGETFVEGVFTLNANSETTITFNLTAAQIAAWDSASTIDVLLPQEERTLTTAAITYNNGNPTNNGNAFYDRERRVFIINKTPATTTVSSFTGQAIEDELRFGGRQLTIFRDGGTTGLASRQIIGTWFFDKETDSTLEFYTDNREQAHEAFEGGSQTSGVTWRMTLARFEPYEATHHHFSGIAVGAASGEDPQAMVLYGTEAYALNDVNELVRLPFKMSRRVTALSVLPASQEFADITVALECYKHIAQYIKDNRTGFSGDESARIKSLCQNPALLGSEIINKIAYAAAPVYQTEQDPEARYTNANVVGGTFTYASTRLPERHNGIQVVFTDKDRQFIENSVYVQDQPHINKHGIRRKTIPGTGINTFGQARRLARYTLFTELNETEVVTFSAGLEGVANIRVGAIIEICDNNRNQTRCGGRIISAGAGGEGVGEFSITVDDAKDIVAGAGSLIWATPNGERQTFTPAHKDDNTITFENEILGIEHLPKDESMWLYRGANATEEIRLFRVMGLSRNEDNTVEVQAIIHKPEKYAFVEQAGVDEGNDGSTLTNAGTLQEEVTGTTLAVTVTDKINGTDDTIPGNKLAVSWTAMKNALKYEVEISIGDIHGNNTTTRYVRSGFRNVRSTLEDKPATNRKLIAMVSAMFPNGSRAIVGHAEYTNAG